MAVCGQGQGSFPQMSPPKIIATRNDLQTDRKYHLTKTKLFVGDNLDPFVIANLLCKTQRITTQATQIETN